MRKFEIAVLNKPAVGGINVWLKPINGAQYGRICLHAGDILDGTGKMPLLRFMSDCIDPQVDPESYAKVMEAPGDNAMLLGGKVWCVSETVRAECASGKMPASDAGGLVNHAPDGKGANGIFIVRKGDKYPVWQCTDNMVFGAVFLMDYEGKDKNCRYWADHPDGVVPYNLPVRVDRDGNFVWKEVGPLSPTPKVNVSVIGFAFSYVLCCLNAEEAGQAKEPQERRE